ncbi:MAG TPA: hypothetical protein DHV62_03095 [Elusimicrobia bacterium]|jgi:ADP-heptose:LPS heptosyltransferase|nr:hypothetical protein [Elusimicrobiota bacterium]
MKRFLIFRVGGVGDTLLLLPFISALRETYSEAYLEFIGYPERIQIFKDFGYVNEIKSFDQLGMSSFFVKESNLPEKLVKYFGKFDIIFAFLKDEEEIFKKNLQKWGLKDFYLFSPYPYGNMHILDYYNNLIHYLGLKNSQTKTFFLQRHKNQTRYHLRGDNSDNSIAIHPGAGSKKKCWPAKYFAEIIDWLEKKHIMKTLLISGPADENTTREVVSHLEKTKPEIIRNRTLSELALLFNHCSLYLGNDSGITHLAAFTGIPTVAIFNQENAKIWSPQGRNVHLCVSNDLENISPLVVKEKIKQLIPAIKKNDYSKMSLRGAPHILSL